MALPIDFKVDKIIKEIQTELLKEYGKDVPYNIIVKVLEHQCISTVKGMANGDTIVWKYFGTYAAGKAGFFACNNCIALFDDFVMTGPEVKDGGHWNPKAHSQIDVNTKDKLTATWGRIKSN